MTKMAARAQTAPWNRNRAYGPNSEIRDGTTFTRANTATDLRKSAVISFVDGNFLE